MEFHTESAQHAASRIVNFYSDQAEMAQDSGAIWISGVDEEMQVKGVTHLSVHVSPENSHYGIDGDYRGCDPRGGHRSAEDVERCENADRVTYGLRNRSGSTDEVWAVATFNPAFDAFTDQIDQFLSTP